jgi:hypothetical protein
MIPILYDGSVEKPGCEQVEIAILYGKKCQAFRAVNSAHLPQRLMKTTNKPREAAQERRWN